MFGEDLSTSCSEIFEKNRSAIASFFAKIVTTIFVFSDRLVKIVEMLDFENFPVTVELSSLAGSDISSIIAEARELRADAFNIPDGILGRLTIEPITLAFRIREATGTPTIAHLTCRDATKLGLAQKILAAGNLGIDGILALSGDAAERNVFEIRTPGLVELIRDLNAGEFAGKPTKSRTALKIAVRGESECRRADRIFERKRGGGRAVRANAAGF